MSTPSNFNSNFEEEITKKLQEIDHRVDRTGWPLLIAAVVFFFVLVYLSVKVFSIPTPEENTGLQHSLQEQILTLEERVSSLEERLEEEQGN